jgi:Protein of unknown function (DUF3096)
MEQSCASRFYPASAPHNKVHLMENYLIIQPLVALIAGILILVMPRLLNYVVAIYLIIVGLTGLWPQLSTIGT